VPRADGHAHNGKRHDVVPADDEYQNPANKKTATVAARTASQFTNSKFTVISILPLEHSDLLRIIVSGPNRDYVNGAQSGN